MKEPSSKSEVANWCIVNALKLPNELIVSITAKLMLHLADEERDQVLRLSSVVVKSEQLCQCKMPSPNMGDKCSICNKIVPNE
jgi:hypothetical protein